MYRRDEADDEHRARQRDDVADELRARRRELDVDLLHVAREAVEDAAERRRVEEGHRRRDDRLQRAPLDLAPRGDGGVRGDDRAHEDADAEDADATTYTSM